jgi:hypothetical protein
LYMIAIGAGNESAAMLLVRSGADPFLEEEEDKDDENSRSPFHASARKDNVGILRLFMEHWNDCFSATRGMNGNGDSALHVLCRDLLVSIQAIKLLVEEFASNVSQPAGASNFKQNDDGHVLLPFHSAVAGDISCSLDVVFFLLRKYPDALTARS